MEILTLTADVLPELDFRIHIYTQNQTTSSWQWAPWQCNWTYKKSKTRDVGLFRVPLISNDPQTVQESGRGQ